MKSLIAVAVSGGVDSMTTAFLLKEKGHEVIGIHFITGFEKDDGIKPGLGISEIQNSSHCRNIEMLSEQLDIPIKIFDCRKAFKEKIVSYFKKTYLAGKTPNPCLVCNPEIKFGAVLEYAKKIGAKRIATGHYINTQTDGKGRQQLLRGDDPYKDQSYFLAFLSRSQLADACFPLGGMKKSDVKKIAAKNGLKPTSKKESQDVCFIHEKGYAGFLKDQGIPSSPGPIMEKNGKIIGEHKGLHFFTIGQRRGINCPAPNPYHVLRLDIKNNRLIVGSKQDLLSSTCTVEKTNWIIQKPSFPVDAQVKIRYQHDPTPATLVPLSGQRIEIHFKKPQLSITPGQGAVFYRNKEVLGGGWIIDNKL
ncbi:MAG: tRNA 2-thiouridine(34) synthase MnmA [Deltaproteobacteria bacterium]|nr:tRNA 2-thiouridine(34) synthase MnmA [Deltaproteobacteria bacterium]